MADLLDQVHAQIQAAATGDLLDQVHAQQSPATETIFLGRFWPKRAQFRG
jgi:hypothetical protein